MLFTDSPYFTAESDITDINPYLTDDLNPDAEGNTLVSITSNQLRAARLMADSINSLQLSWMGGRIFNSAFGISSNHIAGLGLSTTGGVAQYNQTPRLRLSQIVINSVYPNTLSPIQQWHAYLTLKLIYEQLSRRVDGADRFKDLRDEYDATLEDSIIPHFRITGLPWLPIPLPCPGALNEPGSGFFSQANLSSVVSAGGTAYPSLYIAITYVDTSQLSYYVNPQYPNNAESDLSLVFSINIAAGHAAVVSLLNLNPPTGQLNTIYSPSSAYYVTQHMATGWNVYAGPALDEMYLQNLTGPIPIATTSWQLPNTLNSVIPAGHGQVPVYATPLPDAMIFRL